MFVGILLLWHNLPRKKHADPSGNSALGAMQYMVQQSGAWVMCASPLTPPRPRQSSAGPLPAWTSSSFSAPLHRPSVLLSPRLGLRVSASPTQLLVSARQPSPSSRLPLMLLPAGRWCPSPRSQQRPWPPREGATLTASQQLLSAKQSVFRSPIGLPRLRSLLTSASLRCRPSFNTTTCGPSSPPPPYTSPHSSSLSWAIFRLRLRPSTSSSPSLPPAHSPSFGRSGRGSLPPRPGASRPCIRGSYDG